MTTLNPKVKSMTPLNIDIVSGRDAGLCVREDRDREDADVEIDDSFDVQDTFRDESETGGKTLSESDCVDCAAVGGTEGFSDKVGETVSEGREVRAVETRGCLD